MQYLLDTHVLLWWLANPKQLSQKSQNIITDKANRIFVSSISMWEMAIKQELGRLEIPINILSILQAENITMLPLTAEEGLGVVNLPKLHSDPFDRILIVQAKLNNLVFITKDKKIMEYAIPIIKA
jgi:PIN domain nuclease of toxin-antitoxin system